MTRETVATGPFQLPSIPSFSNRLDPGVRQLHSAHYRNPADLRPGSVLVVGCGNSGAQIAVELAQSHRVVISAGHRMTFMPWQTSRNSALIGGVGDDAREIVEMIPLSRRTA